MNDWPKAVKATAFIPDAPMKSKPLYGARAALSNVLPVYKNNHLRQMVGPIALLGLAKRACLARLNPYFQQIAQCATPFLLLLSFM